MLKQVYSVLIIGLGGGCVGGHCSILSSFIFRHFHNQMLEKKEEKAKQSLRIYLQHFFPNKELVSRKYFWIFLKSIRKRQQHLRGQRLGQTLYERGYLNGQYFLEKLSRSLVNSEMKHKVFACTHKPQWLKWEQKQKHTHTPRKQTIRTDNTKCWLADRATGTLRCGWLRAACHKYLEREFGGRAYAHPMTRWFSFWGQSNRNGCTHEHTGIFKNVHCGAACNLPVLKTSPNSTNSRTDTKTRYLHTMGRDTSQHMGESQTHDVDLKKRPHTRVHSEWHHIHRIHHHGPALWWGRAGGGH